MSDSTLEARAAVRLRTPERRQMAMVVQCPDDLVGAQHPVRLVMAVVEKLDLSRFCEAIKAREGLAGRDATDPRLLVGLWLYASMRGLGSARELARRCEESAPFRWLCGGVTVNHRLLSDFRTDHGDALDELFTQVIASLVDKDVVRVSRISQDGVRVRVSAGASSFRREDRLQDLLQQAKEHVAELRRQVDTPEYARLTARQQAARQRAAIEKQHRLEQAIEQLPELKQKQAEAEKRAGQGVHGQKIRERQPRVSTTDAEARRMKMPNGGYMRKDEIERAHKQRVELFVPPKSAKSPQNRGRELEPKRGDSEAVLAWKQRMASEAGKETYKERAATSETVNADLRTHRGLTPFTVRGLDKIKCVTLWCALAYNIMHFGTVLLS